MTAAERSHDHSARYAELVAVRRERQSKAKRGTVADEAISDYGRVLYSPAFRRLQLKTQVFPLEDNASVRSRLTHSLEVAHIGHRIASNIAREIKLEANIAAAFVTFAETACLCHDLGNPPFGHFGETAIQDWFKQQKSNIQLLVSNADVHLFSAELLQDFLLFDGNPQGLRIVMRLARGYDEFGLNLTHTQLASSLKYTCAPAHTNNKTHFQKKPGYFSSEKWRVASIRKTMKLADNARHPISLIMEAADDIAYCMSDIEDAVEKRLITVEAFQRGLTDLWGSRKTKTVDAAIDALVEKKGGLLEFKVDFSEIAIARATQLYISSHQQIVDGTVTQPILRMDPAISEFLECLSNFSRQNVYTASETERLELSGYRAITDIMDAMMPLLECSAETFGDANNKKSHLRRLKNLLPPKHLQAYNDTLKDAEESFGYMSKRTLEVFARLHLLTDFVSGMTDRYAIEVHRVLSGYGAGGRG